jgi:hypothetical protein
MIRRAPQVSDRYNSRFAIVPTIVDARHMTFTEHQSGKGEVESALL